MSMVLLHHVLSASLSASLGVPPAGEVPQDFESRLDQVDVTVADTETQINAYDSDGEVIGTIAIWIEPDGRIHLASDYADGYAETVVTADGETRVEATLPAAVLVERAEQMREQIEGRPETAGWGLCAAGAVGAVAACGAAGAGGVVGVAICGVATYYAACECLEAASGKEPPQC